MRRFIFFMFLVLGSASLYAMPNLIGSWEAEVEYDRFLDTYKINFTADGRCTIKVSNGRAEQETTGTWSYDGSLLRVNATFRNPRLSYLPNIAWISVLDFSFDNKSFYILGRTGTNSPQTRITFFRSDESFDATYDENIIPKIFGTLTQNIPLRSRIAIVGVTSVDPNEETFYLNNLTLHFVNSRRFTIVDRSDVDKVLAEQNFQMSGIIDDDTFVSIGRFIGANVVVTGSINRTGAQKWLVIKAIDVLTSEIIGMASIQF